MANIVIYKVQVGAFLKDKCRQTSKEAEEKGI